MSPLATIGLDVGGTKVAGGLLGESGRLLGQTRLQSTLVDGRRDPGLRVTRRVAEDLARAAADAGLTLDGIGAGFPEYVDPVGRLRSHEVLAWTEQPRDLLADIAPVTVDADVRCAALGERDCGAARGLEDFAFIIVGTGVSYALMHAGHVRRGARGEAIALGELEVARDVDAATRLSLERYASGEGIRQRFAGATGQAVASTEVVFDLAAGGDGRAGAIVDSAAQALGAAVATLVSLLDPAAVVIGGGVSTSGDRWQSAVEAAYLTRAARRLDPPPLRWASLGSDAGVIGAALVHRQRAASGKDGH